MQHLQVLTHNHWEMTPAKATIFTSFGGMLSFIQGFIATGQLFDAALLGAAGAAGALAVSILVALFKKTTPLWQRLYKHIKRSHWVK